MGRGTSSRRSSYPEGVADCTEPSKLPTRSFLEVLLGSAFCDSTACVQRPSHRVYRPLRFLLVDRGLFHRADGTPREVLHALAKVPAPDRLCKPWHAPCREDSSGAGEGALLLPRIRPSFHPQRAQGFLLQVARELAYSALPRRAVSFRLPPDHPREDR